MLGGEAFCLYHKKSIRKQPQTHTPEKRREKNNRNHKIGINRTDRIELFSRERWRPGGWVGRFVHRSHFPGAARVFRILRLGGE